MQVLWNLRRELRCAKVTQSTTDTMAIATQVVDLFNVGGPQNQNTVLLLLDNKETREFRKEIEDNIIKMMSHTVTATIPVVIILNCLHQINLPEREALILHRSLSEEEKTRFQEKHIEVTERHRDRHSQFHAYNIMKNNFCSSVVSSICEMIKPTKKKRSPHEDQLLAILALVNSYVPGSYLTHDFCQRFVEKRNRLEADDTFSLVEKRHPFNDILVIFQTQEGETHVRMAHPMIADKCLQLLTLEGVTRSNTTKNLLAELSHPVTRYLMKTFKEILTKRQMGQKGQKKFSNLIEDISKEEGKKMCVSVLEQASDIFGTDPFLPQVLARFYYIEKSYFESAEYWAEVAINREKSNSFIRDTLGQVYKNKLKKEAPQSASEILHIGKLATKAFEDEANVAENENGPEMPSNYFNNRGLFGYIQVANIIFIQITKLDMRWSEVLTKESPQILSSLINESRYEEYKSLLTSLRDEVENKFKFFEWYLTYSKPSIYKDDPEYIWQDCNDCYSNYVIQKQQEKTVLQMLKESKVSTFAGLYQTCQHTSGDFNLTTEQWREMHSHSPNDADVVQNYILANIILSQKDPTSAVLRPLGELQSLLKGLWEEQKEKRSPEFYLLVLLLFWPDGRKPEDNLIDISECLTYMHNAFENTYKNYLHSRYLVPLFLLKEGEGLQRFIHTLQLDRTMIDHLTKGDDGHEIKDLLRVEGEVRNYNVFVLRGQKRIRISSNHPARVCGNGPVSFYLGFSIKGPVAYNIRMKTACTNE
uniref:Sterile alpha motif domain-containing protein 9-like n=1 Tax=Electrophorus electricus TaxID=8005 RepID=A0AAY5EA69_ELEEL